MLERFAKTKQIPNLPINHFYSHIYSYKKLTCYKRESIIPPWLWLFDSFQTFLVYTGYRFSPAPALFWHGSSSCSCGEDRDPPLRAWKGRICTGCLRSLLSQWRAVRVGLPCQPHSDMTQCTWIQPLTATWSCMPIVNDHMNHSFLFHQTIPYCVCKGFTFCQNTTISKKSSSARTGIILTKGVISTATRPAHVADF